MASLAGFAMGLYAARTLPAAELGAYAVAYAAALFGNAVIYQLLFVPVLAESAKVAPEQRRGFFRRGITLAAVPLTIAAVLLFGVRWFLPATTATEASLLALSAAAAAATMPIQLFARQTMHFRHVSWRAAGLSSLRLATMLLALGALPAVGLAVIAVPLGANALANIATALPAWGRRHDGSSASDLHLTTVLRRGWHLAWAAALPSGAVFVGSRLIASLAGAAALGLAEAARVVAQPITVIGVGLGFVVQPLLMEQAHHGDSLPTKRTRRLYFVVFGTAAVLYALAVLPSWSPNPMRLLVPAPYGVTGLVAAALLAQAIVLVAQPYRAEIIGSGRERLLVARQGIVSAVYVGVAAVAAAPLGALSRPVANGSASLVRVSLFRNVALAPRADQPQASNTGPLLSEGPLVEPSDGVSDD